MIGQCFCLSLIAALKKLSFKYKVAMQAGNNKQVIMISLLHDITLSVIHSRALFEAAVR